MNPLKKAKKKDNQLKEMNTTVHEIKIKMKAIEKTQIDGILGMDSLGK